MAAMLETCPRGEEKSNLFACIFLQRLPREICVLLANVDHKDPKALATRADELWALHDNPGTSTSCTVPVVQPEGQEVDFVADVRSAVSEGATLAAELEAGAEAAAAVEQPEAAAPPTNRRLPRRPGWPPACVSNTGGMETRPHPAHSPAAGRETAGPGATEGGRSRRTISPDGRVIRSAVSG
jgi:hypothetical protein